MNDDMGGREVRCTSRGGGMRERVNIECRCGYVVGDFGELAAWKAYAEHLERHMAGAIGELSGERRKHVRGKILTPVEGEE